MARGSVDWIYRMADTTPIALSRTALGGHLHTQCDFDCADSWSPRAQAARYAQPQSTMPSGQVCFVGSAGNCVGERTQPCPEKQRPHSQRTVH